MTVLFSCLVFSSFPKICIQLERKDNPIREDTVISTVLYTRSFSSKSPNLHKHLHLLMLSKKLFIQAQAMSHKDLVLFLTGFYPILKSSPPSSNGLEVFQVFYVQRGKRNQKILYTTKAIIHLDNYLSPRKILQEKV